MATSSSYNNSLANFVADPASIEQIPGRRVKWAGVDDSYIVTSTGKKRLPAGTVVGEFADGEVAEYPGTWVGASPDEDNTALGILVSDANEGAPEEALSGYGVYIGGVIYENLLPGSTGDPQVLPTQTKTDLGTALTRFYFVQYVDSRIPA